MTIMTGIDALMEILRHEGVEYVFGLPGASEIRFMEALEGQTDIKYILCLQESVIIGAAEGYARTSDKVGFVNLHTNTGVATSLGMLTNANRGSVPLVITAGQIDSRLSRQDPHLTGPLVEIITPFTKWATEVLYANDIPIVMQRAFKMAQQPPRGPVFVSLPQDVLAQSLDYEYTPSMPVLTKMRPDQDAVNKAAALLREARTPAIIVEDGVSKNDALYEVVKLAELTGARVYQSWMADVNFPVQHHLYLGDINTSDPSSREVLAPVDVLVAIGCQLFGQYVYIPEPILSKNTKIIQIDDNPWEIAKNLPADVGIQSNIKVAVAELTEILEDEMSAPAKETAKGREKEISGEKAAITKALMKKTEAEKDQTPIAVSRLMLELRDALKPGTLVVDDCWSASALLRQLLNLNEPKAFQRSRGGGSIGWGLSGAIGVKLAAPDRPVVTVCGDGSAMWSIQSLWTAAHYNLPVKFIIVANAVYRTVQQTWAKVIGGTIEGRHLGTNLDSPDIDFCQIAQGMGIRGRKAARPEELAKTLKSALNSEEPEVVEVLTKP